MLHQAFHHQGVAAILKCGFILIKVTFVPIDILNLVVGDFVIVFVYQPVTKEHQHHIIVEMYSIHGTHYDNIRQMVKEKTGRAMQEKERERKGKNGKIVKIAGCSPIREGVLLVRSDTTLADVRKFGEECQRRWGITPLQIFLHKDEGHWLNGQPEAEDRESFKVGDRWFKPNYHAHIVFDWMNHETGKSRKLNDDDMMQMQTLASDILLMERGQSKVVTGKEHLERNDFIIEKQKAELQRMDAAKRHKEEQINLAEQELKQVKSEIRTDKLKKTATTAATAITSGVASLFGSGKLKELERANEKLQDEVSKRNTNIEKLQSQVQQMQKQHDTQIHNLREMHRQELDMKEKELSRLARIIDKAFRWFPMFREIDSSGLNVPPVSLSNVPGISESNVPPIAETNVPGVSL